MMLVVRLFRLGKGRGICYILIAGLYAIETIQSDMKGVMLVLNTHLVKKMNLVIAYSISRAI